MDKKTYELVAVMSAEATEKKIEGVVADLLSKSGGKIIKKDFWGKRQFTYPIKKQMQGVYCLFEVEMLPSEAVELQKRLKLEEALLRYLLVVKNKRIKEEVKPIKAKKATK